MQKFYYQLIAAQIAVLALFVLPLSAQDYTVNSNGDTHAANAASSPLDAGGLITLRSAMEASTARVGTHTITIPGSVGNAINLTLGQMIAGNAAAGNNITVNGPGKALLTINQTTISRVFSTGANAVTFGLSNLTLNYAGPAGSITGAGGAIGAGGVGAGTTITNVGISNFQIATGNGGAISVSSSGSTHNLTITNCTFTNNKCGGSGGAVNYNGVGVFNISNCSFTGNQTGPLNTNIGGDGGAISTSGGGNGGTYSITNCTFISNQVLNTTAHGGAINNTNGALTVNFCRFVGNTAPVGTNGNSISQLGGAAGNNTNSNNNWWGQNSPTANDNAQIGGFIICTKWLQLKLSSTSSSICSSLTSVITASFLSNSAAEAISAGNLSALVGVPIGFVSPVLGTLSGAQTTIQASGTATVTYTAGATAGAGSANAVVDNLVNTDPVAKATVTVLALPAITLNPSAGTACLGLPTSFTATASNQTGLAWQESANAGFTSPVTLTNTGIYSGTTTTTLSISNNSGVNGRYYRMVASNSNGCTSATSTGALLAATTPTLSSNNSITQSVSANNNLYYAPSCGIISKVVPSGASPVTGNVTSQVWVEAAVPKVGSQPFVQRHYQITPATAAATASGTVTLYFSQAEFDNFNADPGSTLNLPTGPADAVGISNLRVGKYSGSSSNSTGLPASYSSGAIVTDPADANIVWNATLSRWEVTVDVTGFSGFVVQTSIFVLPIKLTSFNARLNNNTAVIKWDIAAAEDGANFDLQRSLNGTSFTTIATIQGDNIKTQFAYNDALPATGKFYYRLQMTDKNGKITYSNILFLQSGSNKPEITLYPNPVYKGERIQLSLQNIVARATEITSNSGQVIYSSKNSITGSTGITLPASIASGVYFIKIFTDDNVIVQKIVIR